MIIFSKFNGDLFSFIILSYKAKDFLSSDRITVGVATCGLSAGAKETFDKLSHSKGIKVETEFSNKYLKKKKFESKSITVLELFSDITKNKLFQRNKLFVMIISVKNLLYIIGWFFTSHISIFYERFIIILWQTQS